jgi:energy-coupling factor transporter transmembrane protein EcfT
VFKSKIGLELLIPIIIIFGTVFYLILSDPISWLGVVILVITILFIIHMFLTTYYEIDKDKLIIKCGFLYNKTIEINTISNITETTNPLSSPALSILERIEIKFGKYDCIIISPDKKHQFIKELVIINPNIVVKLKNKS